jgi:hypothetical protein
MNRILHDSIESAPMTDRRSSQHAFNDQKMNVILGAELPGRAELRTDRIVVGANGEIDRELAAYLHDTANLHAERRNCSPGVVAPSAA